MSVANKIFNRLALRCLCAVFVGTLVVALFSALLSVYGGSHERITKATAQALKFPENEQMLKDLSAQLARESETLSKIAPAAGEAEKPAPKN